MTLARAQLQAGVEFTIEDCDTWDGYCYFAKPEDLKDGFVLQIQAPPTGPTSDPMDGIVGKVSVYRDHTARTRSGVGIGSSVADVLAAYPGRIRRTPHYYEPEGSYLLYEPQSAADQPFLLRFATDGEPVTEIPAGLSDAVTLVEGCA